MMNTRNVVARKLLTGLSGMLLASASMGQVITKVIDSTGDGAGQMLESAFAVAGDDAGNAYVTGLGSNNAFKITPSGVITEIISMSGTYTGHDIAVDASGNVYVTGEQIVYRVTPAGAVTTVIDHAGDGAGNLMGGPTGLALDASGNVYVAASGTRNAFKVTPAGVITEIIDETGDGAGRTLRRPHSIAVDGAGNAYVTDDYTGGGHAPVGASVASVFKITPAGVVTEVIDETGDGVSAFLVPRGIAVDSQDNVYVGGSQSGNVFKLTPGGAITKVLGVAGDGAGNTLAGPWQLAVDSFDNLYVAGRETSNVFKVSPSGVITEIMDGTGDGAGSTLDLPNDVAVDGHDYVYVTGLVSENAFKVTPPSLGTSYCSSLANATGAPAALSGIGDTDGGFILTSAPVPNTIGQFFYGPMMLDGSAFGDGLLCVGGMTQRLLPFVNAGMMMQPDQTATLRVHFSAPYAAGLTGTQHFQHWFRSGLTAGPGFNTSDGLTVTF